MKKNAWGGFTLLELLIALAVAGVLLAIGAPSLQAVVKNQRLNSALGSVSNSMFAGRSEATKSAQIVTVCARESDTQCGDDWNNGLLVFLDSTIVAGETEAVRDTTDEILRVVAPHDSEVVLAAVASTDRTASGAYAPTFVRYQPDGRANWKNGTFYACDDRGNTNAVALHVTISGDIRTARQADKSAAVKDVFGRDLSCP